MTVMMLSGCGKVMNRLDGSRTPEFFKKVEPAIPEKTESSLKAYICGAIGGSLLTLAVCGVRYYFWDRVNNQQDVSLLADTTNCLRACGLALQMFFSSDEYKRLIQPSPYAINDGAVEGFAEILGVFARGFNTLKAADHDDANSTVLRDFYLASFENTATMIRGASEMSTQNKNDLRNAFNFYVNYFEIPIQQQWTEE
jgi:hypothetical protein